MKLCIECAHGEVPAVTNYSTPGVCYARENMESLAVNGIGSPRMNWCWYHRQAGWLKSRVEHLCGKDGRWWKPREINQAGAKP